VADHSEASPIGLSEVPDRLYEGYILDLDGTVYLGDVLLPGAERLIRKLRELDRRVVFLSNNPTGDPQMYADKLTGLGPRTPNICFGDSQYRRYHDAMAVSEPPGRHGLSDR
jgi:ribonucleotide monophosphatase NagD (HAD superfamily)